MLQVGDYIMLGLAFFLIHFVLQTPTLIGKKAFNIGALSYHFVLSLGTYFVALANSTGPFAMFIAAIISFLGGLSSYAVWRIYFFLVWANNWQDLNEIISNKELVARHRAGYPYQIATGIDICIQFSWIMFTFDRLNLF